MVNYTQVIKGLPIRPSKGFFGYSSVTLIKDGDVNILCDTGGYGVREAINELKKTTKIDKVFITHLHFDHCANIGLFKDTPIYIHEDELLELRKKQEGLYSDMYTFIKDSLVGLNIIPFSTEESLSKNTRIVFTPGHTIGHSSLEVINQDKKIIIAGDAIETYQEYLNSNHFGDSFNVDKYQISRNLVKQYKIIIPGHSSIIEDGKLVDGSLELKFF